MSEIDSSIDNDEDLEDHKSEANKDEAEDLAASVGNDESVGNISGALFGSSDVGVDGDSHSDVSGEDWGESTNEEGNCSVELAELGLNSEGKKYGEEGQEDSQIDIFLLKERDSSLFKHKLAFCGTNRLHQRSAWQYVSFRVVSHDLIGGVILLLRSRVP